VKLKVVAPGDLRTVGAYMSASFPEFEGRVYVPHHAAVITDDDGNVHGAVALKMLNHFDATVSLCVEPGYFPTVQMLTKLFSWAFGPLGLKRLTSTVARANKRARRINEGVGFKLEGLKPRGYDGVQPACMYGMTVDQCRWLMRHPDGLPGSSRPNGIGNGAVQD
jgi:hypothetical protein